MQCRVPARDGVSHALSLWRAVSHYILSQFDGTYGNKEEVNMATDFILRVKTMYELLVKCYAHTNEFVMSCRNKEKEDI